MPVVTREVKSMLGLPVEETTAEPGRFGAKDVNDLTWNNLMAAYSCTECGRCTSECPANITGKKLSPRKIMMDVRDRMEEVGKSLASGGAGLADGKSLLGNYTTKEEINACTSCNACVEACPRDDQSVGNYSGNEALCLNGRIRCPLHNGIQCFRISKQALLPGNFPHQIVSTGLKTDPGMKKSLIKITPCDFCL